MLLKINQKFMKYVKESYALNSDQRFSFKYFLKDVFVNEIPPKNQVVLGTTGMNELRCFSRGLKSVNRLP